MDVFFCCRVCRNTRIPVPRGIEEGGIWQTCGHLGLRWVVEKHTCLNTTSIWYFLSDHTQNSGRLSWWCVCFCFVGVYVFLCVFVTQGWFSTSCWWVTLLSGTRTSTSCTSRSRLGLMMWVSALFPFSSFHRDALPAAPAAPVPFWLLLRNRVTSFIFQGVQELRFHHGSQ